MWQLGFGTWQIPTDVCAEVVYQAIKNGYRHIDGAAIYQNEKECGQGVKRAIDEGIIKREDVFITTKLWNCYHNAEIVKDVCERQLKEWGLDYFDMYLIHFPIALEYVPIDKKWPPHYFWRNLDDKMVVDEKAQYKPVYQAMEALVDAKLVRSIGVSNLKAEWLQTILNECRVKPANIQNECHPQKIDKDVFDLCQKEGIAFTAYSSLGGTNYRKDGKVWEDNFLQYKEVGDLATKYGKTVQQIALKWAVQRGMIIIPKSVNTDRMIQNRSITDFNLTEEEMNVITGFNKDIVYNQLPTPWEFHWTR